MEFEEDEFVDDGIYYVSALTQAERRELYGIANLALLRDLFFRRR